jgi:hypothetical protein
VRPGEQSMSQAERERRIRLSRPNQSLGRGPIHRSAGRSSARRRRLVACRVPSNVAGCCWPGRYAESSRPSWDCPKVLALDLEDTLWGVILVLTSKNDHELVESALTAHPEMVLDPDRHLARTSRGLIRLHGQRGARARRISSRLPEIAVVSAAGDPGTSGSVIAPSGLVRRGRTHRHRPSAEPAPASPDAVFTVRTYAATTDSVSGRLSAHTYSAGTTKPQVNEPASLRSTISSRVRNRRLRQRSARPHHFEHRHLQSSC